MSTIGFTPLISVVIAVFNGAATLQQCLDSVTQQTYARVELIVIDGGSTDGTVDLIRAHARKISYWISEPDRGIYNAWNKALAQATGDWVCFLGADDYLWDAQVLAQMAEKLLLVPLNIRVAYGQIMLINSSGEELYPVGRPWAQVKSRFRQAMSIPHPGAMHRHSLFEKHGYFDERFRICGDYELLLRELRFSDAMFLENIIVAGMRVDGTSSRPQNLLTSLLEVRSAQKKNDLRWPGAIWLLSMMRAYIRLVFWRLFGEKHARKLLDIGRHLLGLPSHWTKV